MLAKSLFFMVELVGIEPVTYWLTVIFLVSQCNKNNKLQIVGAEKRIILHPKHTYFSRYAKYGKK